MEDLAIENMIIDYIEGDMRSTMKTGATKDEAVDEQRYHFDVLIGLAARRIEE